MNVWVNYTMVCSGYNEKRLLRSNTLGGPSGKTVQDSFSIYIIMECAHYKHECMSKLHTGVLRIFDFPYITLKLSLRKSQQWNAHTTNMNVWVNYTQVCSVFSIYITLKLSLRKLQYHIEAFFKKVATSIWKWIRSLQWFCRKLK